MNEPQQKQKTVQARALFERLFEFSPDSVIVTDSEGRITNVNEQVQQTFGYPREELIGKSVETLIPERYRHAYPDHRQAYDASNIEKSGQTELLSHACCFVFARVPIGGRRSAQFGGNLVVEVGARWRGPGNQPRPATEGQVLECPMDEHHNATLELD